MGDQIVRQTGSLEHCPGYHTTVGPQFPVGLVVQAEEDCSPPGPLAREDHTVTLSCFDTFALYL